MLRKLAHYRGHILNNEHKSKTLSLSMSIEVANPVSQPGKYDFKHTKDYCAKQMLISQILKIKNKKVTRFNYNRFQQVAKIQKDS
jgi:hypothetical protein